MFRTFCAVGRFIRPLASSRTINPARIVINDYKAYTTLTNNVTPVFRQEQSNINSCLTTNKHVLEVLNNINPVPVRTVTKFSLQKGKRKTVKAAVKRFFRLHWGIWIRTRIGRQKKLWKKTSSRRRRLRQHVFCNSTQSTLLDKMVTKYWKRPKYYVEDPYTPYHTRDEFNYTRKKPM